MSSPLSSTEKPLRRDAAENRQRLLEAAGRVFAERGPDAGVDEVAREAGVGMGTLYRRFANKQALIDELVGELRRELLAIARTAATATDGTGLEKLLYEAAELQAAQSGCLRRLWQYSVAEPEAMAEIRTRIAELLRAAQRQGLVRDEITAADVAVMMWSVRGVIETTSAVAPRAWRRHLELLLAGMRPVGSTAAILTEKPLTQAEIRKISGADR
jgi:AcrR family transcriptional regulator